MLRRLSVQNPLKWSMFRQIRNASNEADEQIVIPNAISRRPTDILYALASTVGRDPTAAHYKYHDDPYLIPMSNIGKRTFAMAQESGRKSARWILENEREFFTHSVAEPSIETFKPSAMVFTEDSVVAEDTLKTLIRDVEVQDAIFVYGLLKKQGVEVSEATRNSLMQLLCYYNHEDTLNEEWLEERWFRQGMKGRERQRKTWKDGELAEKIFAELETKDAVAYCTMIRGMCKFFQVERAYALYQEALDKGVKVDVGTFNSMLCVVNFLKESADLRWELVMDILTTMNEQALKPNLGTLNAVLQTVSTIGNPKLARGLALRALSEFKKAGVEPSLGTWYFMLITFCKERGPVSHILFDIMNEIEGKEFKIRDIKDTFFFVTAMDICRNHLNDKDLAKRVDILLHTKDNYNLIGDSYKESIYYRHFVALLCVSEPLEIFMETYNRLVPNIYTPEPGIMAEILKAVDMNGSIELVPQMWSHMVIFDHAGRENLLTQLLHTMIQNAPDTQELVEKFNYVAFDMWKKCIELQEIRVEQFRLSGQILGDILLLLSRGNAVEEAQTVFEKIDNSENELIGEPSPDALQEFVRLCSREKTPTTAITALQYMVENGYPEAKTTGEELLETMTLDEEHRSKVLLLIKKGI